LENTWRTNRCDGIIKIACLMSWLIMIKIVLNLEDDGSFLMKFIEMEFHDCSEIRSCLRDP